MTTLSWVTPEGTIANLGIGVPASIELLAVDVFNGGDILTYRIIYGSLPTGMTISTAGIISGIPGYTTLDDSFLASKKYKFLVRATSNDGLTVLDRSFTIIVTNIVDSGFNWITAGGNLGTIPNGSFYQLPLEIETSGLSKISFKFVSGQLPPGMQIQTNKIIPAGSFVIGRRYIINNIGTTNFVSIGASSNVVDLSFIATGIGSGTGTATDGTGYLQGVPTLLDTISVNSATTFKFTIRASNEIGNVKDQSFSVTVTNVYAPIIEPTTTQLGSVFDGSYYSKQLQVIELNPNVVVAWSNIGSLPPGVTLDSNTGLLSGYIQPSATIGNFGPAGYDGDVVDPGTGEIIQAQAYDFPPYDFNQLNQTINYNFTVQAYDGANYDLQNYILNVVARSGYTADNTLVFVDNADLTIDTTNIYVPVILNDTVIILPPARANSYYAYKFEGLDFQGDQLNYNIANSVGAFDAYVYGVDAGFDYNSVDTGNPGDDHNIGIPFDSFSAEASSTNNLPGLVLDPTSGWLYGKVDPQTTAYRTISFGLDVSKTRGNVKYSHPTTFFTLPILGDINNKISWVTPANLGTINNGQVSELVIEAKSTEGKELIYSLLDARGISIRLPQGLELLPTGEIAGRVSFETFTVDNQITTFDSGTLTIDKIYKFTVLVSTRDNLISTAQEFTITINQVDLEPYDNLYLRAMPAFDQLQIYNSIISNPEIFVPELIYRPNDNWFGISDNIEMLFLPGLNPSDTSTYANAILKNHYTKTFKFDGINTAVVLDDNYNVKYEVVYINIIDPAQYSGTGVNQYTQFSSTVGAPLEIDLTNTIANPYIDENGDTYKIVYPDNSNNMITRLVDNVGYYDQSSLPPWMTSNQPGPTPGTFNTPIGFIQAVVLAYTKPGASKLIAYRLQNSGINFNNIEFTVDRYFLDNYYTKNFNTTEDHYLIGRETTFDQLPNSNVGDIVSTVNYAVSVPFAEINGRTIDYVLNNGGLDGVTRFQTGDTLIFAQQESFVDPGPYDGWINYSTVFFGDNIQTIAIEGYGIEPYDSYTVVPGFLEKAQGLSTVNNRGGVWQLNIVNGVVFLKFIYEILPNQRVRVLFGKTYGAALLSYNNNLLPGQSVPHYLVVPTQTGSIIGKRTTFNSDSTKFFSNRDTYYNPGEYDTFVKFPQYGTFV